MEEGREGGREEDRAGGGGGSKNVFLRETSKSAVRIFVKFSGFLISSKSFKSI